MDDPLIEPVLIADDGAVRTITLNRPAARNALSGALIEALYNALVAADEDPGVHAVVLTGADPAFCAGVDLKAAAREGAAYFARFDATNCIAQVAAMRTPVIGAINGAAFTGGLEIALGCDFLVASERAVFADNHVRVGVLPGGGMTAHLPLLVGQAKARRMSMTGEVVAAAEALRISLVTEVVAHADLLPRACALASAVAGAQPRMMLALKRIYMIGAATLIDPAAAAEAAVIADTPPAYDEIEQRRQEVMIHNKSQLGTSPQAGGTV